MLLDTATTHVATGGHLEVARATIKASPKVFGFFSDNIYANKYRAICREYAANGYDAHSLNGMSDQPVIVTLPTEADPTIKFRDFGPGMSHGFMLNQFMAYTDGSTKSDTNDQVGGFGVGSKSAFAYTDQFALKVISDGTVRFYTMFKDTDSCPSIALLAQRDMNNEDRTGVEVSFAVQPADISTFHEAALVSLAHFKPQPVLVNATTDYPNLDYIATGANWGMRRTSGPLQIIMGGVLYAVDVNSLTYKFPYDSTARSLVNYGLDVTVPIGTCAVALSREALSYDDRTVKALQAIVEGVAAEVAERLGTMFDGYATRWLATQALSEELGRGYGPRQTFLASNARYKGERLSKSVTFNGTLWTITDRSNVRSPKWSNTCYGSSEIEPAKTSAIFLWDLDPTLAPSKARGTARIEKGINDNRISRSKQIHVIKVRPEAIDALLAQRRQPRLRLPRQRAGDPAPGNVDRWPAQAGRFGLPGQQPVPVQERPVDFNDTISIALEDDDLDDGGIYVPMTAFTIDGNDTVAKLLTGLIPVNTLYFVNKGDEAKLDKEVWTSFADAWAPALASVLAEDKGLPTRLALSDSVLGPVFGYVRDWGLEPLTGSKAGTPLGKIIALYHKYIKTITTRDHALSSFVTAALPSRVDPAALLKSFHDDQPLVAEFLKRWSYRGRQIDRDLLNKVL